ncbi:MAG: HAD family hydrolase [Candidatus Hodarchaeota archaeon]
MGRKQIKYIMFDFDGTIVDSMTFLESNAVLLLMEYYGYSRTEATQYYRETTGLPFVQQMEIIAPDKQELNSIIVKKFEKMKINRIYEQKLYVDSLDVLTKLKERGYKLGISSGTIDKIIQDYLEKNRINLVDDVLGWKPGFEKGTDHFNYVMKRYGFENSNIVFIGDSLHDARRAKNNNISFIGKIGMFNQRNFEKIINGVEVISSLSEILEKFPHLNLDHG